MVQELSPYQWALPDTLEVPRDPLQLRLDFHRDAILMYLLDEGVMHTRMVSALDIAQALTQELPISSGLLPEGALWWASGRNGTVVALWQPPKVWKVAIMLEPLKPPRRFSLPMPGLIFLCTPAQPPRVVAAKRRPRSLQDKVYHAPLYNIFQGGSTCPGTHKYSERIEDIPTSFFISFFSPAGNHQDRSKKYPKDLLKLWEELDGKKRYPLKDLVEFGKVEDLINKTGTYGGIW